MGTIVFQNGHLKLRMAGTDPTRPGPGRSKAARPDPTPGQQSPTRPGPGRVEVGPGRPGPPSTPVDTH
uniref:Translation initiation factor IF-2 n=1 Tax=Panagrellus redivivus TaxID=6233 RepID=A0A7E4UR18_PANRE